MVLTHTAKRLFGMGFILIFYEIILPKSKKLADIRELDILADTSGGAPQVAFHKG